MHGIEPFRLAPREMQLPHGTDLESSSFDALDDGPHLPPFDGIWLDDSERPFGHSRDYNSRYLSDREHGMTAMAIKMQDDPDVHKGAIEGDRPTDEQIGNPHGTGVDEQGLPDDPVATAEDEIGANEDQTEG